MAIEKTPAGGPGPIKGQMEFELHVECAHCWLERGAHMHWCPLAKLTERQRMMS